MKINKENKERDVKSEKYSKTFKIPYFTKFHNTIILII